MLYRHANVSNMMGYIEGDSMALRYHALPVAVTVMVLAGTAVPVPANSQTCGLGASCTVEDLGDDRYRITYEITNTSPGSDVIFKWRLEPPSVSDLWQHVGFDVPPGWSGSHHNNGRIDFQIPNGSGTIERIYSASLAHCGGPNSLQFRWTFDKGKGPVPDCTSLQPSDFFVHVQGVNPQTCNNVGPSYTCPDIVPVEEKTWGNIKALYR
jgi:hypothetical protein